MAQGIYAFSNKESLQTLFLNSGTYCGTQIDKAQGISCFYIKVTLENQIILVDRAVVRLLSI
jgi:hypothetical protein